MSSHQDRYLQAILPWMAAVTAAGLVLLWRRGAWVRAASALLVGFQVVWGSDVYFFRTHTMLGDSPIRALGEYLGAAQQGKYDSRYSFPGTYEKNIAPKLPKDAKVLIHVTASKLGLGAQSVADGPGWQGAIEYLELDSPNRTMELWRRIGVTHAMWYFDRGSTSPADLGRQAVFLRTIHDYAHKPQRIGDWRLTKLPSAGGDGSASGDPTRILWLGCKGNTHPGLYTARAIPHGPALADVDTGDVVALGAVLHRANVVVRRACASGDASAFESLVRDEFVQMGKAGDTTLWVREKGRASETDAPPAN